MKTSQSITFLLAVLLICISCESKDQPKKIYENKIIIIYSYGKVKNLDAFIQNINTNAQRIIDKYNPVFARTVKIYLYPSVTMYHAEIGMPNAPEWNVGRAVGDDSIRMVNPYKSKRHNYNGMVQIALHEYTHVVINDVNRNIPIWLNEGIALMEAGQSSIFRVEVKKEALADKLPFYDKIAVDQSSGMVYKYAGSIVEFIIARFSIGKLNEFIRFPDETSVFKITREQFQKEWQKYLMTN